MKKETKATEVVKEVKLPEVKEEVKLPSLEELMNASNLNDAQKSFKEMLELYKKQNPKKFEVKREGFAKKLINLGL